MARRLGVEGLGKYTVLLAYVNIFNILAVAGIPRLVIREMTRQPQRRIIWFQRTVVSQVLGACVSALLMVIVSQRLHHPPTTALAVQVAALSLFPFALSSAAESVLQSLEKMNVIAMIQTAAIIVQLAGSIFVLFAVEGIVALAWVIVGTQILVALVESGLMHRIGLWQSFHVDWRGVFHLFRQSFDFFLLSLSVVVFSRLDVLVLSQIGGEAVTGLYNAAYLVIRVVNFISAGYSQAVYPVMSRLFNRDRHTFEQLMVKSLFVGTAWTLLAAVITGVMAENIINILYRNQEYAISVFVLRLETPFIVIFMWNAMLSNGLMSGNRQRRSATVAGIKLLIGLFYYVILTIWFGLTGTAVATILAGATGTFMNYYFFHREVNPLPFAPLVAKAGVIGGVVFFVVWLLRKEVWTVQLLAGISICAGLLWLLQLFAKDDWDVLQRVFFASIPGKGIGIE